MRTKESFISEVTRVVRIKAEYEVEEKTVLKNNGLKLHGLTFKGENMTAPTIYLDSYFTRFTNGEMSLDEIVNEVLSLAKNHETNSYDSIAKDYQDFAKVSQRLMPCLVNAEKNADLLREVPHRKVLDLAIIYKVVVNDVGDGVATITVRNEHLDLWGVTEEDLFNKENLFPAKIQAMSDITGMMLPAESDMYIVSNSIVINGAIYMLDTKTLDKIVEIVHSDLYILPSSIHEVICVSTNLTDDLDFLAGMVKEVNGTEVREEEILSDSVYRYDASNKCIKKCTY